MAILQHLALVDPLMTGVLSQMWWPLDTKQRFKIRTILLHWAMAPHFQPRLLPDLLLVCGRHVPAKATWKLSRLFNNILRNMQRLIALKAMVYLILEALCMP